MFLNCSFFTLGGYIPLNELVFKLVSQNVSQGHRSLKWPNGLNFFYAFGKLKKIRKKLSFNFTTFMFL